MYMRNKPIKFGYKLWILASSQGYPFNIQVYVGKEATVTDKIPLGTRVVLDILECVENCRRHILYVDNFFNSLKLLEKNAKKGILSIRNGERELTSEMSFTRYYSFGRKKKEGHLTTL
ncbi:hypothetical protein JTE90_011956 [Oedothorax gibbosus]|uniref:PiggyBac transposable element-derived protein domain-containing protein n=1 Tax=Oedothorax gibbosus TaxID=931172 RepID=A0AAV6V343_9ARAC|nr:hypothetical protein JTE90_011956 [Oedothorax gibbosus]